MNSRRNELKKDMPKLGFSILLDNLEKEGNIGTIIRAAHAFGCEEVLIYWYKKLSHYMMKASRQMDRWMDIKVFMDYDKLLEYIERNQYSILVVDTFPNAEPLTEISFPEKPLIVFGNETEGGNEIMRSYDQVYIPQIGTQNSINVANAASIVMYKIFLERWYDVSRIDDWNCSYSINMGVVVRK